MIPDDLDITGYLRLILTIVDHQTEALDLAFRELLPLNSKAVGRALAILARARQSGSRPRLRVVNRQPEAHPEGRPGQTFRR